MKSKIIKLINNSFFLKTKFFEKLFFGILMGFSDIVPGYSGGTTLSISGIYDESLIKIKEIISFKKNKIINNLLWLLPLIIFWVSSYFLFNFVFEKLVSNHNEIFVYFLFISMCFFSIFVFFYQNKYKNKKTSFFKKNKINYYNIISYIVGFLLILGIGIGVYFLGGISLTEQHLNGVIKPSINWLWICLAIMLSSFAFLIPGISGNLILLVFGLYDDIYYIALKNFTANFGLLVLVGISFLIGLLLSIWILNKLIKKYKHLFVNFSFGFICGSCITMFLCWFGNQEYANMIKNIYLDSNQQILLSFAIIIGLLINLSMFLFIKYTKFNFLFKKNSALLVVDFQNDFYINGKLEVKNSNKILKPIEKQIKNANRQKIKVIFTKDNHPKNHISFNEWPEHCLQNTNGQEIVNNLDQNAFAIIYKGEDKNIDNYSAFYNSNIKSKLNNLLIDNNIDKLYIVGLAGDYCVKQTALDAIELGYKVTLISKCIKSIDKKFKLENISDDIEVI